MYIERMVRMRLHSESGRRITRSSRRIVMLVVVLSTTLFANGNTLLNPRYTADVCRKRGCQVRDTDALFMQHRKVFRRNTKSSRGPRGSWSFLRDNYPAGRRDIRTRRMSTVRRANRNSRPAGQPVVVVVASSSSFRVLKSEPRPSHPEPPFDRRGFDLQPVDERSANACIIHNQFPNPELEMNRRPGQLPLPLLHPPPFLHSPCIPLIFSATPSFKRFLRRFLRENVVCSPARFVGRLRAARDSEISRGASGYVSWPYGLFVVWFFRIFVDGLSIVSSSV